MGFRIILLFLCNSFYIFVLMNLIIMVSYNENVMVGIIVLLTNKNTNIITNITPTVLQMCINGVHMKLIKLEIKKK
jgi:hypothetical protein